MSEMQDDNLSWVRFLDDRGPDNCFNLSPAAECPNEAIAMVLYHKQCGCGRGPGILYCFRHLEIVRAALRFNVSGGGGHQYLRCPGCNELIRFIREDRLHP